MEKEVKHGWNMIYRGFTLKVNNLQLWPEIPIISQQVTPFME